MGEVLQPFLLGLVVMACTAIGVFFWKFWKRTCDRLFLSFAIAFWLFAANWAMLAMVRRDEGYAAVYLFRLLGFVIIIAGVIGKNRTHTDEGKRHSDSQPMPVRSSDSDHSEPVD